MGNECTSSGQVTIVQHDNRFFRPNHLTRRPSTHRPHEGGHRSKTRGVSPAVIHHRSGGDFHSSKHDLSNSILSTRATAFSTTKSDQGYSDGPSSMTQREAKILKSTYDRIKVNEGLIKKLGVDAVAMILARIPEAHHIANMNEDSSTDLMSQGKLFIDGIEQAVTVADKPTQLTQLLEKFAEFHQQRHIGVTIYMLVEAIDSFENVIMSYLQTLHSHRSNSQASLASTAIGVTSFQSFATGTASMATATTSNPSTGTNHMEESCSVCGIWTRFLALLRNKFSALAPPGSNLFETMDRD